MKNEAHPEALEDALADDDAVNAELLVSALLDSVELDAVDDGAALLDGWGPLLLPLDDDTAAADDETSEDDGEALDDAPMDEDAAADEEPEVADEDGGRSDELDEGCATTEPASRDAETPVRTHTFSRGLHVP